jgi:hypothetical protein
VAADRSADDVWAEIQAKCDGIRANDASIATLGEEIPNYIHGVSDEWIERRSDRPRGTEGRSRIYKSEVEKIWRRLSETGEAYESSINAPRFAWALIGRLIDGVAFHPNPFRLVIEDRERAMTPFLEATDHHGPLGALLMAVLKQLQRREQGSGFDPDELRRLIAQEGPAMLSSLLPEAGKVTGSTGMGSPSDVPWIAAFPEGGSSAQTGLYLVYLFAKDGSSAYLSLNQGTEHVRGGRQALLKRSLDLRTVIGGRTADALNLTIDLRSNNARPRRYEAGSALAHRYPADNLAGDDELVRDLRNLYAAMLVVVRDGPQFHPEIEPMHVLLKWDKRRRTSTIDDHKSIADTMGSVWWGRIAGPGASGVAADKLAELRRQLNAGFPTHAYLYRRGELWRASIVEITSEQSEVLGDSRFPSYYGAADCNFFVRVTDFVQLQPEWARDHLVLASDPDPLKLEGALSNQSSPLFVFERFDPAEPSAIPDPLKSVATEPDRSSSEQAVDARVWIFQANPKMYDLVGYLGKPSTKPGSVDSWLLRQYADQVSDGDTVLLWVAGDAAGIYATGTILGESFTRQRAEWEPPDAPETSLAIRYRVEHVLLDKPVLRSQLMNHPVLKDLLILRRPSGTNFPVTEEQWEALRPLIDPLSGVAPEPSTPPDPSIDLDWLLRETLWEADEIEDIIDTLRARRPQIILAGPPGTGKTWVAERIGLYLTGGRADAVHVVQFHPSYPTRTSSRGCGPWLVKVTLHSRWSRGH